MKSKKAMEISPPNLVVVIVLLLMVLLILLFIFGKFSGGFTDTVTKLFGQAKGETCQSAVFMRYCKGECPDGYSEKDIPLQPKQEEWSDCSDCVNCVRSDTGTN